VSAAARIAHVREARRQATLARLLGRELAEIWSALLEAEIEEATRASIRKTARKETVLERLRALLDRAGAQVVVRAVRLHGGPARYTPRDVARTGEWVTWRRYIETRMRDAASSRVAQAGRAVLEDQDQRGSLAERIRALAGDDVRRGRDALIAARNIIATAEGIGREVAYDEAGIEVIEWLAFRSPIWPRRHDLLNGEMRKRGDLYQMPRSEHSLRWPHDPRGHVSEVINCRCSVAPIAPGSAAYRRWLEQSGQGPGPTGPVAPPAPRPAPIPSAAELEAEAAALAAEEALEAARAELAEAEAALAEAQAAERAAIEAERTLTTTDPVLQAALDLGGGRHSRRLRIADLYQRVGGSLPALHSALTRLAAEGRIALFQEDDPLGIGPDDRAAEIPRLGGAWHILYVEPDATAREAARAAERAVTAALRRRRQARERLAALERG
jgi:hypothetical protein